MKSLPLILLSFTMAFLLTFYCSDQGKDVADKDPIDTTPNDSDTISNDTLNDSDTVVLAPDYFPLQVGNTWEYSGTGFMQSSQKLATVQAATRYKGIPAFLMEHQNPTNLLSPPDTVFYFHDDSTIVIMDVTNIISFFGIPSLFASFLQGTISEELRKIFPLLWFKLPVVVGDKWLASETTIPDINNPLQTVRLWVDAEYLALKDFYITDADTQLVNCPGVKLSFFTPIDSVIEDTVEVGDSIVIETDTISVPTNIFTLETYFGENVGPVASISYIDLNALGIPFGSGNTPIQNESLVDFKLVEKPE
jgi:hypothetical protein